jgi:hypothetical protein
MKPCGDKLANALAQGEHVTRLAQRLFPLTLCFQKKELDAQLVALETKQHKAAQAGDKPVDPMSFFESRMTMKSLHRQELNDLENAIDKEHASELKKLRDGFTDATRDELASNKEKLVEKLKEEGM